MSAKIYERMMSERQQIAQQMIAAQPEIGLRNNHHEKQIDAQRSWACCTLSSAMTPQRAYFTSLVRFLLAAEHLAR